MPAASRKGNNSGPLVLPDGQEIGRGHMGYIISLAEDAYLVRNGLLFVSLLHCPTWHGSGASCDRGRTRTIMKDAVDDAYHADASRMRPGSCY